MEQKEILKKLEEYKSLINDIKNKLDIDNKKNKISELEGISNDSSFWNDMENAKNVLSELKDFVIYVKNMILLMNLSMTLMI